MKKNISINISGIIFHIEEDGYEVLKAYLESINKYFSSFDDNHEIIADIEGRIAEIFLSKLNEGKQVITIDDVESLKTTMGSVKDFQAIEDVELNDEGQQKSEERQSDEKASESTEQKGKKLYRDAQRSILGGVASGLANYFGIDSLWVRLLIIILALGTAVIPVLIAYVVMWIVIPESEKLEEQKELKKMFRNPENKVFGGVASGMAAYFGIDVAIIRLLFVVFTILGFSGIAIYIVLWIIVPEAKTITEKVQMEGDPVTLSNIESNIKKNLNVGESEEESTLVKVLLFPFRLIGIIFNGLGKILGPLFTFLVEALRILFGITIVLTSLGLLLGFVVTAGILLGVFAGSSLFGIDLYQGGIPIYLFSESFSVFTTVVSLIAVLIPTLVFLILGVSIIAKRSLLPVAAGWSFFGIWILSLIGLSLVVPQTIYQFRENGEYKETEMYELNGKTAVLKLHETGFEAYDAVNLQLRGHDQDNYKLVKEFESRGRTRREAVENAKLVSYTVEMNDSVFVFDSNISFDKGSEFRGQDLDMVLYIPYNKPFVMSHDLKNIIRNTIYRHGYSVYDMDDENVWIFTPAGLECTTCDKEISRYDSDNNHSYYNSGHSRVYENTGFNSIEIGSAFEAEIEHGSEYSVKLVGDEDDIDEVRVMQEGENIVFEYEDDNYRINNRNRKSVKLIITTPTLDELGASGASKVYVSGFNGDNLYIEQSGASFCSIDADYVNVEAEIVGASELILKGQGEDFKLEVHGASEVNAYNYQVKYAEVKANGISDVRLYVTDQIVLDASLVSEVKYRGGAELVTSEED